MTEILLTDMSRCEPTLNDQQVIDFCKYGYLLLESVVPNEVNQRTRAYLAEHGDGDVNPLLDEAWFVNGVIKNPQAGVRCALC